MKKKYPNKKERVFIGHSFGGLFCLYTLFKEDKLFDRHFAISPSVWANYYELDKIEGTAALDTIYMATVADLGLQSHYGISAGNESQYNAALLLRKNSKISRSAYGELKVKVWDKDNGMAARMANTLLQKIQHLHQRLQNENSRLVLQRLQQDYQNKQQQFTQLSDSAATYTGAAAELWTAKKAALLQQVQQYENLIDQYQITINSNPQVLLTVETAKPSLWPDKPRVWPAVLLSLFAAFIFSFLLALFLESAANAARSISGSSGRSVPREGVKLYSMDQGMVSINAYSK